MNLFMISAPYQLLNAVEAIHYFGFRSNILFIIDTGLFSRKQFERVINRSDWISVRFYAFHDKLVHLDFGLNPPQTFWERLQEIYLVLHQGWKNYRASSIASSIGSVENLILGNYLLNYDMHMRHFANRIEFKNLYLLDVGTDTLRIAAERLAEGSNSTPLPDTSNIGDRGKIGRLRNRLRQLCTNWDTRGVDHLTFFTAYDFTTNPNDQVIKNTYSHLRQKLSKLPVEQDTWFLGQDLVDQSYITADAYREYLRIVCDYFIDSPLSYIPHPRESDQQLNLVSEAGISIRRLGIPLENALDAGSALPRNIASFFSSALQNSHLILGERTSILAFEIDPKDLLKDQDDIAKIYSGYRKSPDDIQVIPFNP